MFWPLFLCLIEFREILSPESCFCCLSLSIVYSFWLSSLPVVMYISLPHAKSHPQSCSPKPFPSSEHSWHQEAQRGRTRAESSVTLQSWHWVSKPNKNPIFPPFSRPKEVPLTLSSPWAQGTSMENDPFEGWSGFFERRFSSRSVSQRCSYLWTAARAPRPRMCIGRGCN